MSGIFGVPHSNENMILVQNNISLNYCRVNPSVPHLPKPSGIDFCNILLLLVCGLFLAVLLCPLGSSSTGGGGKQILCLQRLPSIIDSPIHALGPSQTLGVFPRGGENLCNVYFLMIFPHSHSRVHCVFI